jgi:hypothetical protein
MHGLMADGLTVHILVFSLSCGGGGGSSGGTGGGSGGGGSGGGGAGGTSQTYSVTVNVEWPSAHCTKSAGVISLTVN